MTDEVGLGCDHYRRKCSFITPCCKREYICRICHDEKENHELNRKEVQTIKCLKCGLQQKVNRQCESCETLFGHYFCEVCRLYDDTEKGQFHCDKCGICRVGGRENYFHCDTCDLCLGINLKDKHKCVQESSRRNCAVCLEYLHTSRNEAHVPKCGHLIHSNCYRQCLKTGIYACPTCNQSLVDMKAYWEVLDTEIANTPMPVEYKDFFVQILCKDCHKESRVQFHVIGHKCQHKDCGSYNTCRTGDPSGASNCSTATGQDH
ncbi:hypothetical protein ACJMK2_041555 [Sinanodonta woodiana]|uniref:Uncharacterized protein n=1 Tax=Sinanodonta woodiana TaxID=1069815 RepID=A0ABD3W8A8_SINWO